MRPLDPGSATTTAGQCRNMGLMVGDTIEGREEHHGYWGSGKGWHEARLTLVWLGDAVAVFRVSERTNFYPQWTEPQESAGWELSMRDWFKVAA